MGRAWGDSCLASVAMHTATATVKDNGQWPVMDQGELLGHGLGKLGKLPLLQVLLKQRLDRQQRFVRRWRWGCSWGSG